MLNAHSARAAGTAGDHRSLAGCAPVTEPVLHDDSMNLVRCPPPRKVALRVIGARGAMKLDVQRRDEDAKKGVRALVESPRRCGATREALTTREV
jgi:hypothetical protein